MMIEAIFLVGFMGAGKTTVGRVLAKKLSYEFRDLDSLIEAREGRSIRAIFAEMGEGEFRRIEREVIETLQGLTRVVIALGGGSYASEENRALLRKAGKTVWLNCPLELCLARISGDKSRPLLASRDEMRALLESRLPAYACADYAVQAHDDSPEQVAAKIIALLNQPFNQPSERDSEAPPSAS
jgi:shikimate kinase